MSSSISSSDAWPDVIAERVDWRRFAVRTPALAIGLMLGFYAIVVPLDPYGAGILTPFAMTGTFAKGPRIGNVSRVHDERFNAAIFGNSHIVPLAPGRLSERTGLRFAMLAIPGTDPPEEMQVLDSYLARHSRPAAVVVSVDPMFCADNPADPTPHPFPNWLYSPSRVDYLMGLARLSTLDAVGRRVALLAGLNKAQPADGSMDIYEGHGPSPADAARTAATPPDDIPAASARPGLDMLEQRLYRMAPETAVVVVLPPVAPGILPRSGTPTASGLADCKARLGAIVAGRPKTALVDWHRLDPRLLDPSLFFDGTHYYEPVAQYVELDLVQALAGLQPGN